MRSEIDTLLKRLLATHPDAISLDDVGEAIGAMRITQDEIEQLLVALERAGRKLGEVTPKVRQNLRPVLDAARRLRDEKQARPNMVAIASETGLSIAEVRAALLYASVLGR